MNRSPFKTLALVFVIGQTGLILGSAHADTMPPRKPGFWQSTMVMDMSMNGQAMPGGVPMVSFLCSDTQTDAIEIKRMTSGGGACENFTMTVSGSTYHFDGSCTDPMGGSGAMVTHGTITLEGDSAYHVESTTTSPHMSGHLTGDAKWVGACPAGIMPGDVGRMVNGQFIKTTNMSKPPPTP